MGVIAGKLGKYSFYAYFAQAVFYSVDKLVYESPLSIIQKWLVLNISIGIVTLILIVFESMVRRRTLILKVKK